MVPNGKGKDHETTFVPHVHPTTLDDLDLEAGYRGDKQSDNDKGARLTKVLLGGVFCALLLVCCGAILFFGTQEQSSSTGLWQLLRGLFFAGDDVPEKNATPRPTKAWNPVEPPNIRFQCSVNSEKWYNVYLDPKNPPFNAGAQGSIFKAQIRESNGGNGWKTGSYVIVKVPIFKKREKNELQVVNEGLEANRIFANMAAKPHPSEEHVRGGSELNDFGKHLMKVYGIADLTWTNLLPELHDRIRDYRVTKENNVSPFYIYERVVVAEYCEHGSLRSYLEERGERKAKLELPEIGRVAEHICCALQLIHLRQMAHRDVKPDNILVRKVKGGPPTFVLGDPDLLELKGPSYWGCAGTPDYMPNHLGALQFDGTPCHSARQDWYGLLCSVLHCAVPVPSLYGQIAFCCVQREGVYCRNNILGKNLLNEVRKSGHEIANATLPQVYYDSDAYMEKYMSTPLWGRPRTVLDEFENLLSENMTGGWAWCEWVREKVFPDQAKNWCRRIRFFLALGIPTQGCQGRVLPRGPTFDEKNPGPSIRRRVREMMSALSKGVEAVRPASKHGFIDQGQAAALPTPPPALPRGNELQPSLPTPPPSAPWCSPAPSSRASGPTGNLFSHGRGAAHRVVDEQQSRLPPPPPPEPSPFGAASNFWPQAAPCLPSPYYLPLGAATPSMRAQARGPLQVEGVPMMRTPDRLHPIVQGVPMMRQIVAPMVVPLPSCAPQHPPYRCG